MRRTRLVCTALAVTGLSFGAVACGDDSDDGGGGGGEGGETSLDLVIGDSVPLSGDLGDFGPPGQKAADLAIEEINSAIEEAGADHTVEIVHEDNGGGADQQAAVSAARKLVDSDGASCITGAWASADTIPTAESVTIDAEVPLISPASTSDEITAIGGENPGLVNRTAPPDSFQGPTLANYIDQEIGADGSTANVGARNDAYGTGLAETFSGGWEDLGGEIGSETVYDPKLPSYDAEASDITEGDPDATVIVDFPETYNKVGPALVRAGFDPGTTFVTDGLISGDLAEGAGDDAVNGLRGTAPGVPDDDESSKAFDEAFKQFEPKDVERMTFDAQNFDAVVLCYLSAVAAGSDEGADMAETLHDVSAPGGEQYTWEELPEAIEALENGEDIDYQGASGAIDMDENGDATAGVYDVFEFKNGAPEPVDEVEVETGE
ncbi:ABC transporter substrate-binding protein [Thermoleophilia bacterium SCSIO 60948]|nr:ABC transporter substrate-binding protein [Thermoleophilia bacterium SCSIO 60948]